MFNHIELHFVDEFSKFLFKGTKTITILVGIYMFSYADDIKPERGWVQ